MWPLNSNLWRSPLLLYEYSVQILARQTECYDVLMVPELVIHHQNVSIQSDSTQSEINMLT